MPTEIGRTRLPAATPYLAAAAAFAGAAAGASGLPRQRLHALHEAVAEACSNVARHAFGPGEEGHMELVLEVEPGWLVLAVEDQGLPVDVRRLQAGEGWGRGLRALRSHVDEVAFRNLGTGGKRVEMRWRVDAPAHRPPPAPAPAPADAEVQIRLMTPDDSEDLARCIYRSYGYTYSGTQVYYPEQVEAALRSGLQVSAVAVAPGGQIVGHLALTRPSLEDRVVDCCQAVVDPRWRGHRVFERLKARLVEEGRGPMGLYGLYSEAVALHPFSQKGSLALGAREVGLEIAAVPATMQFHGIEDHPTDRSACMLLYLRLNGEPERILYAPPRHEEMLRALYDHLGLARAFAREAPPTGGAAALTVQRDVPDNEAFLAATPGPEFRDLLAARLRELCLQHVDVLYLDLPLGSPACPDACREAEELGFSFCGVVPELRHGDVLRLQFLNEVEADREAVRTASPFGLRLADYVFACLHEGPPARSAKAGA